MAIAETLHCSGAGTSCRIHLLCTHPCIPTPIPAPILHPCMPLHPQQPHSTSHARAGASKPSLPACSLPSPGAVRSCWGLLMNHLAQLLRKQLLTAAEIVSGKGGLEKILISEKVWKKGSTW